MPNELGRLEALLFSYGEPLALNKIADFLALEEKAAESLLAQLEENLKNGERGLTLIKNGKNYVLATKPEHKDLILKLVTEEFREELTPASLETLSLVAYLGPVARTDLDYIRGVNSSFTLRSLALRGLVEKESGGSIPHYRLTSQALAHLGVQNSEALPEYENYRKVFEEWKEKMKEPRVPAAPEIREE